MRQKAWNVLLVASGISASAALAGISQRNRYFQQTESPTKKEAKTHLLATSAGGSLSSSLPPIQRRSYKTSVDEHYKQHGSLPLPKTVHAVLPESSSAPTQGKNILVIGDVHGCYEELLLLHERAVQENDNTPFEYVILVGDLCNKGPASEKVVRHVRTTQQWLAIRGNHDDAALKAALGDPKRLAKAKYQWVQELTDDDIQWLAELPYTLRIPASRLCSKDDDHDTLIVHAGLIPNVPLQQQTIETMVTIREVVSTNQEAGEYAY